MGLATRIGSTVSADQTTPGTALGTPVFSLAASPYNVYWTSGTATGQADRMWSKSAQSLAASGTDSWDLQGSLTDGFGLAVVFAKLKYIRVTAASTNTNNVVVTVPASNGILWATASSAISVKPGGLFEWADPVGVAVTASTADLLSIVNSAAGTAVVYDIVLIGTSA